MSLWKNIESTNYSVSSLGEIRNDLTGKFLNPYSNIHGRYLVDLRKSSIGRVVQVHSLVAKYFLDKPSRDCKLEINHIDGDPSNNDMDNLEYVTSKENIAHSIANGLRHKTRTPEYEAKAQKILSLSNEGYSQKEIAKMVGVNPSHISRTLSGKVLKRYTNR